MTTDDVPAGTERLVYIGRRMDGTQTFHGYIPLDGVARSVRVDADLGARFYSKPLHGIAGVGQVIEVTRTESGRVFTAGEHRPRIIDPGDLYPTETPSRELQAAWSGADRAAYVMAQQIKTDRRLAREAPDPLHAALDVVRDAFRAQRGIASRAAFARYVEEYLHS